MRMLLLCLLCSCSSWSDDAAACVSFCAVHPVERFAWYSPGHYECVCDWSAEALTPK